MFSVVFSSRLSRLTIHCFFFFLSSCSLLQRKQCVCVCVPLGFCTLEKLKPYTISSLQAGSLTRLPNTVLSLMEGTQKVFLFLGFLNLNYFQLTKGSEHTIMPQKQNKKNCLFFCTLHSLSVFTNELHGILSGV